MSYTYNPGDPVTVLVVTEPNGAVEPVSILDDAIKQIKKYLNDGTAGPKALITALTTTVTTNATTAAAANTARIADIAALDVRLDTIEGNTGGKAIVSHPGAQSFIAGSGIAPITFDTEEVDSDGAYNPVSFTYTAPADGLYLVIAQVAVETASSTTPDDIIHQLDIFVDASSGAIKKLFVGDDENQQTLELIRTFNLTAGQTISTKYTLTVGSGALTVDLVADSRETILQISRIVP